MEQAQYWMWTKRKHADYSNNQDSWKERAFLEDNPGGYLGDYTWPPRSYSCCFCGREFKSAQALGGHMNVHRRDRARLKQSPNPPTHQPIFPHHPLKPMHSQQKFSFIYTQNSDSEKGVGVRPPAFNNNTVRVHENEYDQNDLVSPLHSSLVLHENREVSKSLSAESWSSFVQDRECICGNDLKNGEKGYQIFDSKCSGDETDLSMNLDLLSVFRSRVNATFIYEARVSGCKRRKMVAPPYLASLPEDFLLSEVVMEELDLELRLGIPQK